MRALLGGGAAEGLLKMEQDQEAKSGMVRNLLPFGVLAVTLPRLVL